ncbi:MAG TPA: hypothetical protein VIJ16_04230 [Gemmatimonadaceae bacterium]
MRDVAVSAHGTVFMLDSRSDKVDAFVSTGQLRAQLTLTKPGAKNHVAGYLITPFDTDGVLVYDAIAGRVHAYTWAQSVLAETRAVSVGPEMVKDMCALGDTVYLLSNRQSHMIQAYRLDGRFLKAFGTSPGSNPFVQSALVDAGGNLACSEAAGAVIVELAADGSVSAFHRDGSAMWKFAIPDFSGLAARTMPDSSVQLSWSGSSRDAVASIFPVGPADVAVQVRRLAPGGAQLETIIVRVRDGTAVGTQNDIPMMRRAGRASMIGTEGAPPVHARLYRFRFDSEAH